MPNRKFPFTGARGVAADGARIAFVSCLTCGATLMIDPADEKDVMELHRVWHERQNDALREA